MPGFRLCGMPASVTIGQISGKESYELVSRAIFWADCRKEEV